MKSKIHKENRRNHPLQEADRVVLVPVATFAADIAALAGDDFSASIDDIFKDDALQRMEKRAAETGFVIVGFKANGKIAVLGTARDPSIPHYRVIKNDLDSALNQTIGHVLGNALHLVFPDGTLGIDLVKARSEERPDMKWKFTDRKDSMSGHHVFDVYYKTEEGPERVFSSDQLIDLDMHVAIAKVVSQINNVVRAEHDAALEAVAEAKAKIERDADDFSL